jgi:hypothetical protein
VLAVTGDAAARVELPAERGVARVEEPGRRVRVVSLGQLLLMTPEAGVLAHAVAGGVAELAALLDLVVAGGGGARQVHAAAGALERKCQVDAGGGAGGDPEGKEGEAAHQK